MTSKKEPINQETANQEQSPTKQSYENVELDNQKIKRHMILSTIYKPVSMLISFIYVPVFLACLGDEKYGVWVTISSILTWLTNFDVGIGNGLRNRLAAYYAKGDKKKAQSVVSTSYCILGVISLCLFAAFFLLSVMIDLPAFMKITLESEPVNIVLIIAAACVCVNFVLGLCGTIFYALQESSKVALKGIAVQLAQLTVAVVLMLLSKSSLLLVAIFYGGSEIIVNIIFSIWLFGKRSFLIPKPALYRKEDVNHIVSLGIQFFILQICALVIYSADNIIISKYIGASEVTPYSIVHNVFTVVVTIHGALNMPMWSAYTAADSTNNLAWIKQTLKKILLITALLSLGTLILVPLFKPLAGIWLHKELYYVPGLIALEALYTILALFANSFSSLLSGVNYVRNTVVVSVLQAIINIPLSIFLATSCGFGLLGVKIGSVIALGLSALTNPIWCYQWYQKRKKTIMQK